MNSNRRLNFNNTKTDGKRQRLAEPHEDKKYRRNHPIEETFKERIVGQLGPIYALSNGIRRKQNGWHDEERPLVFMFCGPSGVGKTELAKALAEYMHGKNLDEGFIRIDMSEYQQSHEVSKFIGSPPGYVSHSDGGQLTEKLKKCPDAVVLLDEIEKAHTNILTIMLQLFDEGRITDGRGTTVRCQNAIFIMTSNLAQREIAEKADFLRQASSEPDEFDEYDDADDDSFLGTCDIFDEREYAERLISISHQFTQTSVHPLLHNHFRRDEFLGRINEILIFLPFNREEICQLVRKQMTEWAKKARSRFGISMIWDDTVIYSLASGYNKLYGARSIKYEIERKIINPISLASEYEMVLKGGSIQFVAVKSRNKKEGICRLVILRKGK